MPSDAPTPPTSRTAAQVCPVCQSLGRPRCCRFEPPTPAEQERAKVAGQVDAAGRDALVTVGSLAVMLGWVNVPPREVLERSLNALKARAALVPEQQQPPATAPVASEAVLREALEESAQKTRLLAAVQAQVIRGTLRKHYLAGIECSHELQADRALCACATLDLGYRPSVGMAVESWIDHALASAGDQPASEAVRALGRIAGCNGADPDWTEPAEPDSPADIARRALASTPAGQPDDEVKRLREERHGRELRHEQGRWIRAEEEKDRLSMRVAALEQQLFVKRSQIGEEPICYCGHCYVGPGKWILRDEKTHETHGPWWCGYLKPDRPTHTPGETE